MAYGNRPQTGPLQEAERITREQPALLADLSARLFPQSTISLDEATVASARAVLFTLVSQIEAELGGSDEGIAWPVIARSRLLDQPRLLAYLLAQSAWLRLQQRMPSADLRQSNAWLAGFAGDQESLVGQSAIALLSARSRPPAQRLSGRYDVSASLLREIVRQVEAALQSAPDAKLEVGAARHLLKAYDESDALPHIATRLAVQLGAEGAFGPLRQPTKAGLDLFAGSLAAELDCHWYDIVRIMSEGGPRLTALLRAADFARDEAMALLALLHPSDEPDDLSVYTEISKEAARRLMPTRMSLGDELADA